MPKTAFSQWDPVAANNTDINNIPLSDSMVADQLDDAIREVMAQLVAAGFVTTTSSVQITGSSANALTVNWSDNGASIGPVLALGRVSTSPAASDILGAIDFYGRDSGGNSMVYAREYASIVDPTNGSEDGALAFQVYVNGTLTTIASLTGTGLAITGRASVSGAAAVTLTDAATIPVDMSTFYNAIVTLGGNRTLGQPSNAPVGQSGVIRIVQDGTGSRTLSYHADWKFAFGSDPTLSTTAGAVDLLFYDVIDTNFVFATLAKAPA
jgi:hypothetical protein